MGTCRGLNLLLGVSLSVSALRDYGYVALLPTIYIAAVTVMGRSEVHGGKPTSVAASTLLITGVAIFLVVLSVTHHYSGLIFVIGLLIFVLPAFIRTYQEPQALNFRSSVKNGVLGLVVLEGAIAASFAGFLFGLGVVMLLVPAKLLARRFAVT
jgi:4-hydroxybenzoate polyprenyltransferase